MDLATDAEREKAAERDRVLTENYPLLWWFVGNRLPVRLTARECAEELVSELGPHYIRAVDYWLKSDRRHQLSAYVSRTLTHAAIRMTVGFQPIRVPLKRQNEPPRIHDAKIKALAAVAVSDIEADKMEAMAVCDAEQDFDEPLPDERVAGFLGVLTEREAFIVRERFGVGTGSPKTLRQLSGVLGISKERVRQEQMRAMRKMRSVARAEEAA